MVGGEARRTLEEILVPYLLTVFAVEVVPCDVNTVPFAVVHLNVVPHMTDIFTFVKISENAHAGDIHTVADELEALGVALADDLVLDERSYCGRIKSRIVVVII